MIVEKADTALGEWQYLPDGVMTHFRPRIATGELYPTAICDAEPNEGDDWHGAGSQNEYDRVLTLPHCRLCRTVLSGGGH